jgi:hypothetical protein
MEGHSQFSFLAPEVRAAFASVLEPRLLEGEDLRDVLVGSERLGLRRAELWSRVPWPVDVEFALATWCWWPFKPELPQQAQGTLRQVRARAFSGAAYNGQEEYTRLVPDGILRLSLEELYAQQQTGDWITSWL